VDCVGRCGLIWIDTVLNTANCAGHCGLYLVWHCGLCRTLCGTLWDTVDCARHCGLYRKLCRILWIVSDTVDYAGQNGLCRTLDCAGLCGLCRTP